MEELTAIQKLAVLILPLIFAVTVHEAAHGWMAKRLGDSTALMLGRVTFNPLKHIDPLGTVILPLAMYLTTGFIFGWAKPVPVNWRNLRNPRRDMALVALAGPGANLLMALLWAVAMRFGAGLGESQAWLGLPLIYMGGAGILINSILMLLNLLPILPLDGGRVTASLLPPKVSYAYSRLEPWGLFIVVGLLMSGALSHILTPLLALTQRLLLTLVGLI